MPTPNKGQRMQSRRQQKSGLGSIIKFVLAVVALGGIGVMLLVGVIALSILSDDSGEAALGPPAPGLNAFERLYLQKYLGQNLAGLRLAVAPDDTTQIQFVIAPGETADQITQRLQDEGLIVNAELLQNYLRYRGWDSQIEAGTFFLSRSQTIPEIASALTNALPNEVQITIWPGWRLEQIAESLAAHPHLNVNQDEFLNVATGALPPPNDYALTGFIPAGNNLEGFFLPGTYNLAPESTALEVIDTLLRAFDQQVIAGLQLELTAQPYSLYEVVTIASIVQREAVLPEEYATIAAVYLNRLAIDMPLEADPTTQYGLGGPGDWWPRLNVSPRDVIHSHNTYVIDGLPPTPIASPGLDVIRATLAPADVTYLFFRAACDGSGRHNFSHTYEQHLSFAC